MSKVVGVHHITLKEGVTGEALEQFFEGEYQALGLPNRRLKNLPAERGQRHPGRLVSGAV